MRFRLFRPLIRPNASVRRFNTSRHNLLKVAVLGAAGGIGQPLSLLLKQCSLLTDLSLYDIKFAPGVATDLSHIETDCKVKGYKGEHQLKDSVRGRDIIIITAGFPRKPGMSRDDLFVKNAYIVQGLIEVIAETNPNALIGIVTNPVNSIVPFASEILRKSGKLDPKRVFGVSTLDVVRANTFISKAQGLNPKDVNVPVVGGHSGKTIIPLISQATPQFHFSDDELKFMTEKIQEAGTEVVNAKEGSGSATLSMAYAGARFVIALARALRGDPNVVECAYVASDVSSAKYFASPLLLGKEGVVKNFGIGEISPFEKDLLKQAIPQLQKDIKKGEQYAKQKLEEKSRR